MADKPYNVLFLCTGNSARSIMAECALNRWGRDRFQAYSAGSQPKGRVHPMILRLLRDYNHRTDGLRSKSWDEFAEPGAPPLDFVFTVCDSAANEVCPVWPGQPMTAHWSVEDPAAFVGGEERMQRARPDLRQRRRTDDRRVPEGAAFAREAGGADPAHGHPRA
jgi:protein-tyrosine-phosphatase